MPSVYRVTYPNGKIYVGVDHLDLKASYFGSPSRTVGREIEADFTAEQLQRFTVERGTFVGVGGCVESGGDGCGGAVDSQAVID